MKNIINKKNVVLIIILVLFSQNIYASYYDYDIENNIDGSTIDNEVGNIRITKTNHVSENIYVDEISHNIIEKYDKFYWEGDGNIIIKSDGDDVENLSKGEFHQFSNIGTFTYENENENDSGTIEVKKIPELKGKLKIDSDIDFDYDDNNYEIDSGKYYEIKINNVSNYYEDNEYKISFLFFKKTKNVSDKIFIEPIKKFNITNSTIKNITKVKAGDYVSIGFIELENKGNTNYDATVSVIGEIGDYINVKNNIELFKGARS
ncbi:MAG: hypothetical protein ACOCP8_09205, partial [archaeon]